MTELTTLEQAVRSLEDKWELRQLVDRYAVAVDSQDADAVMALFTDDPVVTRGATELVGQEQVRGSFQALKERNRFSLHSNHSLILDRLTEDTAAGRVFGHAEVQIGPVTMSVAFRNTDEYARTESGWRIHRRHMDLMYALPRESTQLDDELRIRWPGAEPQAGDFP